MLSRGTMAPTFYASPTDSSAGSAVADRIAFTVVQRFGPAVVMAPARCMRHRRDRLMAMLQPTDKAVQAILFVQTIAGETDRQTLQAGPLPLP